MAEENQVEPQQITNYLAGRSQCNELQKNHNE